MSHKLYEKCKNHLKWHIYQYLKKTLWSIQKIWGIHKKSNSYEQYIHILKKKISRYLQRKLMVVYCITYNAVDFYSVTSRSCFFKNHFTYHYSYTIYKWVCNPYHVQFIMCILNGKITFEMVWSGRLCNILCVDAAARIKGHCKTTFWFCNFVRKRAWSFIWTNLNSILKVLCAKFGSNCPNSPGVKIFKKCVNVYSLFSNCLLRKRVFYLNKLEFHSQGALCKVW